MDQGKVVEDGAPDHLLQQKGHFWGLYALQSRMPAPETQT
jgi:ABC-type multidrug transport system fused ATPase/permease subunit